MLEKLKKFHFRTKIGVLTAYAILKILCWVLEIIINLDENTPHTHTQRWDSPSRTIMKF